jgi:hypothetical protein
MGHHDLRHDKECQNCGHTVEVEYCSKCGQQNTETRQPFHHLITHTIEDITHYDGNFWKTIKYLLFRPGKLTTEYLLGHRMRYVPPVKLYIFISFVCFFIMALMAPDSEEHAEEHDTKKTSHAPVKIEKTYNVKTDTIITITATDIFKRNKSTEEKLAKKATDTIVVIDGVKILTVRQLDSVQDSRPNEKKLSFLKYYEYKIKIKANSNDMSKRDFIIALAHTLPKVLFIYMPLFAFWLWVFHGKRRWYFFDHGIFTLHYFSFLLLVITINMILTWIVGLSTNNIYENIFSILGLIIGIVSFIYPFFYFFRAHSRFYGETKTISRIKSFILFFINVILIIGMCIITLFSILLNSH